MLRPNEKALSAKLVYPCSYPIKVIGKAGQGLRHWVEQVVKQNCDDPATFTERPGKKGNYIAITALIKAHGPGQISDLHNILKQHPAIKMVL